MLQFQLVNNRRTISIFSLLPINKPFIFIFINPFPAQLTSSKSPLSIPFLSHAISSISSLTTSFYITLLVGNINLSNPPSSLLNLTHTTLSHPFHPTTPKRIKKSFDKFVDYVLHTYRK